MKKLNIILVYDSKKENILMCKRKKEPYKGKLNLVGGKVELGEDELEAAYRELREETGISEENITLNHLMNFQYYTQNKELEVYIGKLNKDITLIEEINELIWIPKNSNFYDLDKYAGEGNIWHIVHHANNYMKEI